MKLYYNPISTYSQKALLALHEKGVEFEPEIVTSVHYETPYLVLREAHRLEAVRWGSTTSTSVQVEISGVLSNAIFVDGFESGDFSDWSASP